MALKRKRKGIPHLKGTSEWSHLIRPFKWKYSFEIKFLSNYLKTLNPENDRTQSTWIHLKLYKLKLNLLMK